MCGRAGAMAAQSGSAGAGARLALSGSRHLVALPPLATLVWCRAARCGGAGRRGELRVAVHPWDEAALSQGLGEGDVAATVCCSLRRGCPSRNRCGFV